MATASPPQLETVNPSTPQSKAELAALHHHNRIAYAILTLLGAGLLLPWNAVVNAVDYFNLEYPGENFEYYVALAYIYPSLPLAGIMVKWGDRLSFTVRIVSMFIVQGAVLIAIPLFSETLPSSVSFWTSLVLCVLIGIATSVLQPSLFGFSSQLPPLFNQAVMAGQGVAGVGVSVLRILTKAFIPNVKLNALLFFSISCVFMLLCVVLYFYILRMEFTQYHLERAQTMRRENETPRLKNKRRKQVNEQQQALLGDEAPRTPATPHEIHKFATLRNLLDPEEGLAVDEAAASPGLLAETAEDELVHDPDSWAHRWFLFKKMMYCGLACMTVFIVTFVTFPGEITSIKYHNTFEKLHFMSGGWWPIVLVTLFNCFDLTGRSLAGVFQISDGACFIVSLLRFVFVPLFVLSVHVDYPHIFTDLFTLLMVAAYALSNGYTASVALMQAPSRVAPHDRETAGFLLSLLMQGGIFIGAQFALVVRKL